MGQALLPNKATIEMDGQQIKLQIFANELAYKAACYRKDFHQASQYRILIDQLKAKLKEFHNLHMEAFVKRYPTNTNHGGGLTREDQHESKRHC